LSETLPTKGRIAGIDYGSFRVGVAVSDPAQLISSPLENYTRTDEAGDAEFFRQLVRDEELVGFVVGLPVHSSGDESEKSREARQFGKWLEETTELPISYYDERYSTALADQFMMQADTKRKNRKKRRDMLAAQVILAGYLDSARQDEHHGEL
jgi:putative holliday junction resolvase